MSGTLTTLNSGSVASLGINTWHTLALTFQGSTITAKIDGTTVGSATDPSYSTGLVGLAVSGWQNAQFSNFSVVAASGSSTVPTAGMTYNLINRNSGLLLDVSGASTTNGGVLIQYQSNGGKNQQWQLENAPTSGYFILVNVNSGLVLDVPGFSTTEGIQLDQWGRNNGSNQQWKFVSQGDGYYTIVNLNSGYLVDVDALSTANNAVVDQWPSNGGANQQWSLSLV